MKIFDFLDAKYRSTAADLQKEFSPFTDGKAKAAHSLIAFCRTISKWFHIPVIITEYLLVLAKLKQPPVPPDLAPKPQSTPKLASVPPTT